MNAKDIDPNNNILIACKISLLKGSWYYLKRFQTPLNNINSDKNIRTVSKTLKLFTIFFF